MKDGEETTIILIGLIFPLPAWATKRIWWFVWMLLDNKLPIKQWLFTRHIQINQAYVMCDLPSAMETRAHLFAECPAFKEYFKHITTWAGLSYSGLRSGDLTGEIMRKQRGEMCWG